MVKDSVINKRDRLNNSFARKLYNLKHNIKDQNIPFMSHIRQNLINNGEVAQLVTVYNFCEIMRIARTLNISVLSI